MNLEKNYEQWKCDRYEHTFEHLTEDINIIKNGIHTINHGRYELDVYANNIHDVSDSLPLFVFFNGAVTNREEKVGPFFSGLSISKQLGLPCISFSDPTIDNNQGLNLAWYAGSNIAKDLRSRIIDVVNLFHKITKRNIILFAGSGGGFAALSIIDYLEGSSLAVAWNPQTSISLYNKETVARYLDLALNISSDIDAYQSLTKSNIQHDLCRFRTCKNNSRVLYLQNLSDWHLKIHALPYAQAQQYKITRHNGQWHNNLSIYLGNFGSGHAAPSREVIEKIIKLYCSDFYSIIPDGYLSSPEDDSKPFIFSTEDFDTDDFDVFVTSTNHETKISIQTKETYPFKNPAFAFYTHHGGMKEIQPYSKNNTLIIKHSDLKAEQYQVQAFLFDDGHRCYKFVDLKTSEQN